ncbi:MAG TPA: hypothetical protein VNL39_01395 [Xanthobacteraceae bacterium]|nr:hypothetical protein [Xanthobacteraceae bacterium]
MLLGDIIARLKDDAAAGEALFALGDLPLTARVLAAAEEADMPPGEFTSHLIGQFVCNASDEDWLTLIGRMSRADDPGRMFLRYVLSDMLARPSAEH